MGVMRLRTADLSKRSQRLLEALKWKAAATPLGLEPRLSEPKSLVLPLHHGVGDLAGGGSHWTGLPVRVPAGCAAIIATARKARHLFGRTSNGHPEGCRALKTVGGQSELIARS